MPCLIITQLDSAEEIKLPEEVCMSVADWETQFKEEFHQDALGINGVQHIEDATHRYGEGAKNIVFVDVAPEVKDPVELVQKTIGFIAYLHTKRAAEQLTELSATK